MQNKVHELTIWSLREQDLSSDSEQQPPFGGRKYGNALPQRRGITEPTGTSYNLDKVWSGAPDVRFGK